jgi:hypothetical protein
VLRGGRGGESKEGRLGSARRVRREGLGLCRTREEGELRGEGVRRARREGLEGARTTGKRQDVKRQEIRNKR